MTWVLNIVYMALLSLLSPVILWKSLRYGRYRDGWMEKLFGRLPIFGDQQPVVWFHAVSVGEVLQLQKIVQSFREDVGDAVQILVTTSTDTGFELANTRFPGCTVSWFPLDFSWAVTNAVWRVRPQVVVLVELELWPNFLNACAKFGAKTALINARMSDRSFRGYSRINWLTSRMFARFSIVAAQNSEAADRLVSLGAARKATHVTGSVKFDGVSSDRRNAATCVLRSLFAITADDTVLIAGSTQAPEEKMAVAAWQQLREVHDNLRLILVPRHRERFDEVADMVRSHNVPLVRRSQLSGTDHVNAEAVILLDTVGELSACWGLAEIAFVGGSFGSRGGQNMLEPAAYGAAVLFGPNTWNFKDIVAKLLNAEAAVQLQTQGDFQSTVAALLADSAERRRLGQAAQSFVSAQQGAIARTVALLTTMMPVDEHQDQRHAA
ncbi:MAG: 3-deoxy-D-manno-octulosonic acid transferase [Planctomycetaceae bacterium]